MRLDGEFDDISSLSCLLKVEISDNGESNYNEEESETDENDDFLLVICIVTGQRRSREKRKCL